MSITILKKLLNRRICANKIVSYRTSQPMNERVRHRGLWPFPLKTTQTFMFARATTKKITKTRIDSERKRMGSKQKNAEICLVCCPHAVPNSTLNRNTNQIVIT